MKTYVLTYILLIIDLSIAFGFNVQNIHPQQEGWEKVERLIEEDLPESALEVLDSIGQTAAGKKDIREKIKIKLYQYRIQSEKDPDSIPQILTDFEKFINTIEPVPERQLLFCMLAEMYQSYYRNNQYTINRRTDVAGNLPENPETWSKNHYEQKIKSLLDKAWNEQEIIKNTKITSLKNLFVFEEKKEHDKIITPTLFDYLAYTKISIADKWNDREAVREAYANLIRFRKSKEDISLTVLAEINYLNYLYGDSDSEKFLQQGDSLEQIYQHNPAVVEILYQKATHYLAHTNIQTGKKKAYEICKKGIQNYPEYPRIGLLHNILAEIEEQSLFINSAYDAAPFGRLKMHIRSTNIAAITLEVFRLNTTAKDFEHYLLNKETNVKKASFDKKPIETFTINLPVDKNFESIDTTIYLPTKDYGIYEYIAYPSDTREKDKMTSGYFTVTGLTFIRKAISEEKNAYYVLDRITGKRIKQVEITSCEYKWNNNQYDIISFSNVKTNSHGYAELARMKSYGNEIIILKKGNDCYFSSRNHSLYYNRFETEETSREEISIFTDRSIYRPGQTVYFKAIIYELSGKKQAIKTGKEIGFELIDANGETVNKVNLNSNRFGSVSGSFVLPFGRLNGDFQIRANDKYAVNFSVEEYKRPTFEITFEQPAEEVNFGEEVTLKGGLKTFTGYYLPDTKIKYIINRNLHPLQARFPYVKDKVMVLSGETTTDAKGKFSIRFTPKKDKKLPNIKTKQIYRYTITVNATDTKGESRQATTHLSVGEQSLFILADIPEFIEKQEFIKFKLSSENLLGEKIPKLIRYQLFRLTETTDYRENLKQEASFTERDLISEGKHNTQADYLTLNPSRYPSGRYKIRFTTEDKQGNPVESEHIFILFDKKDNQPPIKTYAWLPETDLESLPGETVKLRFGTSVQGAHILMEVKDGNELVKAAWFRIHNHIRTFNIPFEAKHKSGLTVDFIFARDEQIFRRTVRITEKTLKKKLTPKLSVFSDKLGPGEHTTWTIHIPEIHAKGKNAELLAAMYDASLDELNPHKWEFYPVYKVPFFGSISWTGYQKYRQVNPVFIRMKNKTIPDFLSPKINWFGFNTGYADRLIPVFYTAKASGQRINSEEKNLAMSGIADDHAEFTQEAMASDEKEIQADQSSPIRSNFNETAFFYPHLQNDDEGNYLLSFTMPESLTRWKLKLLAHTTDLYYGQTETELVTRKDLMVQPNMPRFVRQSDTINLSANLMNLSKQALKVKVKLTFINPETGIEVLLNDTNALTVSIPADGTPVPLSWTINGFDGYEWLICKIVADGGIISDGEQRHIIILSDKTPVTETYPIFIGSDEIKKKLEFKDIKALPRDQAETRHLSFEFSANPVWHAIQAFPALSESRSENAIDYFTAWYVNTLAGKILTDNPSIKAIFEQVKQSKPDHLQSALYRNQELKNTLLAETPWLTEARDETEQQQRIALLFDLNRQRQLQTHYLEKLSELQLPDGAFSWFEGMGANRQITQIIAEGLLKSRDWGDKNTIDKMLNLALNYLEGQLTQDYLQLKKQIKANDKKMFINTSHLQFLALRTQVTTPAASLGSEEAMTFYLNQTLQYHSKFNLYDKALAAIILHNIGKPEAVNAILKSLKENASRSKEKGMYWAKNKSGYRWDERPVSVQVKLMEAFLLKTGYETEVEEMKTWVIRQKQTRMWESPLASVNAIYALIGTGNNLLQDKQQFSITIGQKSFDTDKEPAGAIYFKQKLTEEDIKNGIFITRKNQSATNTPAWGTLYRQYFRDADQVKMSGNALKIEKQLWVEHVKGNRKTLFNLGGETTDATMQTVKRGDKIISRLIVATDNDLEFVALKDNRSANLEPVNQLSGSDAKEGLIFYKAVKDASTQYFFNRLPKGTYVFEEAYFVNTSGNFSGGTASIQCLYAPEFTGTSQGTRLTVRE